MSTVRVRDAAPDSAAIRHDERPRPLLRVEGVVKAFAGVLAVDDVSLEVGSGEIVAIVGHNGSGKSTLVKILAGVYEKDAGAVELLGDGPTAAELHFIHQDLGLIPELSALENFGLVASTDRPALAPLRNGPDRSRARDLLARFGQRFDVDVPVRSLTPAQRSIVAIARALDGWRHHRNVLVLDEPTEALHRSEVDVLFTAVRRLAADGAGIVFISHRLDEVLALADRVVVLRDARRVAEANCADLDHNRLVEFVTGAAVHATETRAPSRVERAPVLRVEGLRGGAIEHLDLEVAPGEVVGIAGALGSGREDVAGLLFGATPSQASEFVVSDAPYPKRSPTASIARGIAFVPGDRARYGSIPPMRGSENLTLPELRSVRNRFGALSSSSERAVARREFEAFGVHPHRPEQTFAHFSGGNQQKIVMAKWLRNLPNLLLLDEPTQGVDIGAKASIYRSVDAAAERGTAVLVCSSDAKELVRLCSRVLVLRDGRVAAELSRDDVNEHRIVTEGYGMADPHESNGTPS